MFYTLLPEPEKKVTIKERILQFFLYLILFCIGFAVALISINRIYAVSRKADAQNITVLPEECYIGTHFQFPLPPPPKSGNHFDDIDAAIEVQQKNDKYKYHLQVRRAVYSFEPLIAVLIVYILSSAAFIIVALLHCFHITYWPLSVFGLGFQIALYILLINSFIKYLDPEYCIKAFLDL